LGGMLKHKKVQRPTKGGQDKGREYNACQAQRRMIKYRQRIEGKKEGKKKNPRGGGENNKTKGGPTEGGLTVARSESQGGFQIHTNKRLRAHSRKWGEAEAKKSQTSAQKPLIERKSNGLGGSGKSR